MVKNRDDEGGLVQRLKAKRATCHPEKPMQARGLCATCYNKWLKETNPEFAERQRQNCRNWLEKNKDKQLERRKKYVAKKDPNWLASVTMRTRFGLTPEDYALLANKYNNCCWICKKPNEKNKRMAIDHDHETGDIRGLLCFRCNFGLSYFSESPEILQAAAQYLLNGPNTHKEIWTIVEKRLNEEKLKKESQLNIILEIAGV